MGADISLQRLPNQATIYDNTYTTVLLMNRILEFILKNADISDMVSLSTDDGCKKWIIVAESKLDTLFDRIRIQPDIGKDGVLYLKPLKDFDKKMKQTVPGEVPHVQYCKVLAFFFVRLFQVVGALALSVIDTELPQSDYTSGKTPPTYQQRTGVPFLKKLGPKTSLANKFKGLFTGGAIIHELDNYVADPNNVPLTNQYQTLASPPIRTAGLQPQISGTQLYYGSLIKPYEIKDENGIYTIKNNSTEFNMTFNDDTSLIIDNVVDGSNLPIYIKTNYNKQGTIVSVESKDVIRYILELTQKIKSMKNKDNIFIVLSFLNYINGTKIKDTSIEIDTNPPYFSIKKTINDEKKTKIEINFNVEVTMVNLTTYKVQIKGITILPKSVGSLIDVKEKLIHMLKKPDGSEYIADPDDDTSVINDNDARIVTFRIKPNESIPKWNNLTIPKYLESQLNILLKKIEKTVIEGVSSTQQGYITPVSNIKVKENYLKYSELWQQLSKKPSIKAFCTARALQLLNTSGLARAVPSVIHPLVFSTTFPLVVNKSLPRKGEQIIEAAPFKSLHTLYDFPTDIMQTFSKTAMQDNTVAKAKSLDQLIYAFTQDHVLTKMEDIREPIPTGVANPSETDILKIKEIRQQAIKLFQEQFSHTKKVGALLKKIFIVDNAITLNPAILHRGIVGIEEIAVEARNLLTEYYSKCQTEYNIGVKILTR